MSPWIAAARPKTLPLAVSGILLGTALAHLQYELNFATFLLGILTAVLLQILSNFANDYGDYKKGTDQNAGRSDRMLTAGKISEKQMRSAIAITSGLTFISGLALLWTAGLASLLLIVFLVLGLLAIAAAIKYTVGKNAYAYSGLGDLFVFIFFGLVAVSGIYLLQTLHYNLSIAMASMGQGLLATAVLNINNIRDIYSDAQNGKRTIPVRLGLPKSLLYHRFLCWLGTVLIVVSFLYHIQEKMRLVSPIEYALIIAIFSPIFILVSGHMFRLNKLAQSAFRKVEHDASDIIDSNVHTNLRPEYNAELKSLSLTILGLSAVYCVLGWMYHFTPLQ